MADTVRSVLGAADTALGPVVSKSSSASHQQSGCGAWPGPKRRAPLAALFPKGGHGQSGNAAPGVPYSFAGFGQGYGEPVVRSGDPDCFGADFPPCGLQYLQGPR